MFVSVSGGDERRSNLFSSISFSSIFKCVFISDFCVPSRRNLQLAGNPRHMSCTNARCLIMVVDAVGLGGFV